MPRAAYSRAWEEFQASRSEIRELMRLARSLPDTPTGALRISSQELVLRAVVVALVANLQVYLENLLEEWADALVSDWEKLSSVERKYVLLQARRRLAVALEENSEERLGIAAQQSEFINAIRTTSDWLDDPTTLASSPDREQLPGFYRDLGANAINRAFSQLRGDGAKFFDWCTADPRYSQYFPRVNECIKIRNEIAHGRLGTRLTLRDVRVHRTTINRLVSKADAFVLQI